MSQQMLLRRKIASTSCRGFHRQSVSSKSTHPDGLPHNFFATSHFRKPKTNTIKRFIRRNNSTSSAEPDFGLVRSMLAVHGLVGVNVVVFAFWQYGVMSQDPSVRNERLNNMEKNWTLTLPNLSEGRWWTTLTAAFSHQNLPHIVFNMFTLNAFGDILATSGVGPANIITLYVICAFGGSVAFLYQQNVKAKREMNVGGSPSISSGLGASGAVMGMGAVATCFAPMTPMRLFFIPVPIPLVGITVLYAAVDAYLLDSESPLGHSAHLGGVVSGVLHYALYLRKLGGVALLFKRGMR